MVASSRFPQGINTKFGSTAVKLLSHLPALQAGSSDTLTAIAVLVVAIGFVGLAILILFSKKKI